MTTSQLFAPMPSGVGPFGQVPLNPGTGTWLGVMLTVAADVQLPTTSWQSGAPERTILAIQAVTFYQSDVNVSTMAQGGFLQSAASGTVTFVAVNGTTVTIPVTPDPSNPAQNPNGLPGYLDLLANNVYSVTRLQATRASGPVAIVNLLPGSVTYTVGAYHVANTLTAATYANAASLTIPSSAIAGSGGQVAGVAVGATSTIVTTTSPHGLAPGASIYLALPPSTGVTIFPGNPTPGSGFVLVTAVTSTTFACAPVGGSSGTWTSGGTVYLCTVATVLADVAGIGSNAGPGQITTTVTQNAGIFCSNLTGLSGNNWENNASLLGRCVLSLANRSPNGPSQSYVYFAETAGQLLAAQTPPYVLTNGACVAVEFASPTTGVVTTVVASSTPESVVRGAAVTPGCAQLPVSGISNASAAVVTCSAPHGLTTGMTAAISGVLGALGPLVNGNFVATVLTGSTFSIPVNTSTAASYTVGGQIEGGDLGAIDVLIQTNVVPDNSTAATVSANALPISTVATVIVPQAYVAAYQLAVSVQLAAQLSSYAIGGSSSSVPANSVAWDDILAALEEAGVLVVGQPSYVKGVQSLSITDGVATATQSGQGVPFPANTWQALTSPGAITVIGV